MKLPGIGDVKNSWVMIGGGVMGGVVFFAYYKNRKTKEANAAAAASATQSSQYADTSTASDAIDPSTGMPYAEEMGSYGMYGGIDPTTGEPYAYENYQNYGNSSSNNTITNNQDWVSQAEQDGQTLYNATNALAVSAVGKYMSQTTQGLNDQEYLLMQEILAELGNPPTGGPYRLIHAPSSTGTGTGGGSGGLTPIAQAVGQVVNIPTNISSFGNVQSTANYFDVSVAHLQQVNPGLSATATTGQINIPFMIKSGTTVASLAARFKESTSHIEQVLNSQGIE